MAMMTGGDMLMKIFLDEGVEYVFGLPGTTELLFLDALEDHPEIKYVLGLHEVVALGMAEGYARVSGKAGVVNLHTCSGLAAAMPMLLNAYLGGEPLVVTAGKQDARMLMQEPHLAGDLVGLASHFTKWSTEVCYAEDIPIAVQRAFKVAMQPPTGPVFVSLPRNIMLEECDFDFIPSKPLFTQTRPDPDAVIAATELLAGTSNPAILVEAGVTRNHAMFEVIKLAELIGARVYQGMPSDSDFPNRHPQYMGSIALSPPLVTRELLQSVDVLVAIGAQVIAPSGYSPKPILTAKTRVIHIDDNPWEIGKNSPADVGIVGNIKISLIELCQALREKMTAQASDAAASRAKGIAREKEKTAEEFAEKDRQEADRLPVSPSRLAREIRDSLRPGTIIVEESTYCERALARILDYTQPLSLVNRRGGGSIGHGLPAAIGAKLAAPDRPVVAIVGDGCAIWSNQSLWTAAHYNIPVTIIVCNNASYASLKMGKVRQLGEEKRGRYLGLDFDEPRINFGQMAQSMGVAGQRVERPEELSGALRSAIESGKPALVDVLIEEVV